MKTLVELIAQSKKGVKNTILIATAATVLGTALVSCKEIIPPIPNPPTTNSPPIINSNPVEQINEKELYEYIVDAEDPDGDKLQYSFIEKPSWVSSVSENIISGTAPETSEDTNYSFKMEVSDGKDSTSQEWNLTVKDTIYTPQIELELIVGERNFNEEGQTTLILPDKDMEGNPVDYTNATPLDENIRTSCSGNELTLIGELDKTGDYNVKLGFEAGGGTGTATLNGFIYDMIDISGVLQDNETDSPQKGIVRVYDPNNGNPSVLTTDKSDENHNNFTDEAGKFSFQVNKRVSSLDRTILQAGIGNYLESNSVDDSYIRTRILTGEDNLRLFVRIVAFDDPLTYDNELISYTEHPGKITPEQFKTFMEETNFCGKVNGNYDDGLKKWNFGELEDTIAHPVFKEIVIIKNYTENGITYSFSNPEMIKTLLQNSVYPKANEIPIEIYDELPPTLSGVGRGFVCPNNNLDEGVIGETFIFDQYRDGYLESFRAMITTANESNPNVIRHEVLGHGMNYPGHTITLDIPYPIDDNSIMAASTTCSDFQSADIKGSYIVGELNYKGMEKSDDILGLNFINN